MCMVDFRSIVQQANLKAPHVFSANRWVPEFVGGILCDFDYFEGPPPYTKKRNPYAQVGHG